MLTLARRYTRAQNSVGQLLLRGHGCAADPTAAVLWFRKAAAQAKLFSAGRSIDRRLKPEPRPAPAPAPAIAPNAFAPPPPRL